MENPRGWYEAEGLMADPKNGHHTTRGTSEEEIRAKDAPAIPESVDHPGTLGEGRRAPSVETPRRGT